MAEADPLASARRVIVVSNVLPVTLTQNPRSGKWVVEFDTDPLFEDGPIYTGIANCTPNAIFVGVPPINVPLKERDSVAAALARHNCYPVYVPAREASLHYQGMCKSILWPLFHNVIDLYNDVQIQAVLSKAELERTNTPQEEGGEWYPARSFNPQEIEVLWPAHLQFVLKFRSVILSLFGEGDLIWIHDYHLMMLVGHLRRLLPPSAPIGIFLHTPFPSSEVFRCLSKRQDILESMLQADHVGFHSYEYARAFLTCTQRMLGFAYGAKRGGVFGIRTNKGRTVTLTTTHGGLDMKSVSEVLTAGLPALNVFKQSKSGVKVICGVDEVEGLRGVALKLLAFDRLLVNCPALRGKIVLKQVGLKLDSRPHDFTRCLEEIQRLVTQLNEKWGSDTVMFEMVTSMSLAQRLSLYADSDIFFQSCVRWGLSVDAMEFGIANRARAKEALEAKESTVRGPGVIVTTEFVSSSRVLTGAIKINPWSIEETAKALEQAANMSLEERIARCFRNLSFIEKNTVASWACCVLRDLASSSERARKGHEHSLLSYGLGVGMRAVGVGEGRLERLDTQMFCESFASAKNIRVLCFDYSGTLVATTPADVFLKSGGQARSWHYSKDESRGAEHIRQQGGSLETRDPVSPEVVKSLQALAANSKIRIVVMSMDLRDELLHAMKDIPNIILVAENGYATYLNNEWRQLVEEDDAGGDWYGGHGGSDENGMDTWQKDVRAIIEVYVERTSGAFIFTAPSSVTFNYLLADPELGEHQSKSLSLQLETRISGLPLVLERGKGTVTVRNRAVNRGAVLGQLFKLLPEPCDFVACFGDDVEDELMFRAAIDSKVSTVYTCRVGVKDTSEETKAKYYFDDESDVADLLDKLCENADSLGSLAPVGEQLGRQVSNGSKPMSTNRSSFAMLPGGFVTKKSLLNLASMADTKASEAGEVVPIGGSPSLKPRKPPSVEKLPKEGNLPHTPSMGVLEDLAPAPSAIPDRIDSDERAPTTVRSVLRKPSGGLQQQQGSSAPQTILKKLNANAAAASPSPAPSPSPTGASPGGAKPVATARQQQQQQQQQALPQQGELTRLAAAAVGGAVVASAVFMLFSGSRRKVA